MREDTNTKIALLLQQQTYEERMEMASWFCEAAQGGDSSLDDNWYAQAFANWAEGELDVAD